VFVVYRVGSGVCEGLVSRSESPAVCVCVCDKSALSINLKQRGP
jgi:hypothetical protein